MDLVTDSYPVWGSGPETSSLNIKESWTETNMDQEILIKLRMIYFSHFTAKEAETWREAVTCPIQAAMEPGPDSGSLSSACTMFLSSGFLGQAGAPAAVLAASWHLSHQAGGRLRTLWSAPGWQPISHIGTVGTGQRA